MGRPLGAWVGGVDVDEKADPWTAAAAAVLAALLLVPAAGHWYARHWLGVAGLTTMAAAGLVLLTASAWQTVGAATLLAVWLLDVAHAPRACRVLNLRLRRWAGQ